MNIFLSCVKTKRKYPCKAKDMYISPLFIKSLQVARKLTDDRHIFILSAKYGLLRLEDEIEPYNLTLKTFTNEQIKNWGGQIRKQAQEIGISLNGVYLCGETYIKGIRKYATDIKAPLAGRSMGMRLKILTNILNK